MQSCSKLCQIRGQWLGGAVSQSAVSSGLAQVLKWSSKNELLSRNMKWNDSLKYRRCCATKSNKLKDYLSKKILCVNDLMYFLKGRKHCLLKQTSAFSKQYKKLYYQQKDFKCYVQVNYDFRVLLLSSSSSSNLQSNCSFFFFFPPFFLPCNIIIVYCLVFFFLSFNFWCILFFFVFLLFIYFYLKKNHFFI